MRLAARVLRAPRRAPRAFACLQTVPQTEAVVGNVELRAVQTAVDHAQVVGRRTQQESVRNGSWRSVLLVR